jgi:hypothetical protein
MSVVGHRRSNGPALVPVLVGLGFALPGCGTERGNVTAPPTTSTGTDPRAATATTAVQSTPSASAAAPLPPDPRRAAIPALPTTPSPRPTREEWGSALAINTGAPERAPVGCSLRLVREWLLVECSGQPILWRENEWKVSPGDLFEQPGRVEVRLYPGCVFRGKHERARLTVAWPPMDDRPWNIALEAPLPPGAPEPIPRPEPLPRVVEPGTERPSEADWARGTPVNTSGRATSVKDCTLLLRSGWARMSCRGPRGGGIPSWESLADLGIKNEDYFVQEGFVSTTVQLEFRLRRGARATATLLWSLGRDGRVELRHEWPPGAPAPTVLSVEES